MSCSTGAQEPHIGIDPYRFHFMINTRFRLGQCVCPCLKRLIEALASSAGPLPRGLLTGLVQQQLDRGLTVMVESQPPHKVNMQRWLVN